MCKAVEDLKAMGRTEGIAMGRKEGFDKGRKEGIEMVAANALKNGIPPNKVQSITGLSESRISQLAREARQGGNS